MGYFDPGNLHPGFTYAALSICDSLFETGDPRLQDFTVKNHLSTAGTPGYGFYLWNCVQGFTSTIY